MLWHYTNGLKLQAIKQKGELRPAGNKQLWFSTEPDWEPTAGAFDHNQTIVDRAATAELLDGVYRFGVDPGDVQELLSWQEFTSGNLLAQIGYERAEKGVKNLRNMYMADHGADVDKWYVTRRGVHLSRCTVEVLEGESWVPFDLDALPGRFQSAADVLRRG